MRARWEREHERRVDEMQGQRKSDAYMQIRTDADARHVEWWAARGVVVNPLGTTNLEGGGERKRKRGVPEPAFPPTGGAGSTYTSGPKGKGKCARPRLG